MIVLDEQLLGRNIERDIAKWYRGAVKYITDLRPHTIIKDDAIPDLLRQQNQPTFITINERDFWQKATMNAFCCIICFTLPDSRVQEIPHSLRIILSKPELRTKAQRIGKIIRVTDRDIRYYTYSDSTIRFVF